MSEQVPIKVGPCNRTAECGAMMHWSDCKTNPKLRDEPIYTAAQLEAAVAEREKEIARLRELLREHLIEPSMMEGR